MSTPGELVVVCANPGMLLFDHAGDPAVFASLWLVDWSVAGAGGVLFVCRAGEWRMVTDQVDLGRFLATTFVGHFGEVQRFGVSGEPGLTEAPVDADLDLERGLSVAAGDVALEMHDILDRRVFAEDGLTLGGVTYGLRNVFVPCAAATVTIAGESVDGQPEVTGGDDAAEPSSSAFLAVAETWIAHR